MAPPRVAVVVLGDVGRSPRMQYHALSLAKQAHVDLVGYAGSTPHEDVLQHKRITLHQIQPPSVRALQKPGLFLLYAAVKVVWQVLQWLWTLLVVIPTPRVLLLQNPPSIPILAVALLVRLVRGSRVVVDWHNFGYTILQCGGGARPGPVRRAAVAVHRWYERVLGARADGHLCVTDAMRVWLEKEWGIEATVLHDHPPAMFQPTPLAKQAALFARIPELQALEPEFRPQPHTAAGKGKGRPTGRPAMLISSTSWTPDEDFGLLLDALVLLEARIAREHHSTSFPRLTVVITGKGPQRAHYMARIAELPLAHIRIVTAWLAAEDYPLLLGACDLGVSLHASSSGLDLPMKVVDMFGCGLPVCACAFPCIDELVHHGKNGYVFHSSEQLAEQLHDLFLGFPAFTQVLDTMRTQLAAERVSWDTTWAANAQPLFTSLLA